MRIAVCDDQGTKDIEEALDVVRKQSNADWQVTALSKTALRETIEKLLEGVDGILENGADIDTVETELSGADLLLLDYGLTKLDRNRFGVRLTAEHIAGYIRAFTDVPYVVSLNKLRDVDFDLKYLLGDFNTNADLALSTKHLELQGLWSGRPDGDEFCPWYWPTLSEAATRRRRQIEMVEANVDAPILGTLGFPDEAIERLSSQAIGFLSPKSRDANESGAMDRGLDVREVTFWNHFCSSIRTLTANDKSALLVTTEGAQASDGVGSVPSTCPPALKRIVARVVAGELDFWFRRDVLGPQNCLIDAPHVQMRLRFRTDAPADVRQWSLSADGEAKSYGLDPAVVEAFPNDLAYPHRLWTGVQAFWVHALDASDALAALASISQRQPSFVFCEDTRQFADRKQNPSPHRFETNLTKAVDIRYVRLLEDYNYSPLSALAR